MTQAFLDSDAMAWQLNAAPTRVLQARRPVRQDGIGYLASGFSGQSAVRAFRHASESSLA